MRIVVDRGLCQGHGVCHEEAPEVFDVDVDERTVIVRDESPPGELRAMVSAAVKYCPTRALTLRD